MSALRIGTRGSALALAQARWVAERVGGEIVVLKTSGDSGAQASDKSRWVDTIEAALAAGEIDLAVHSAKDVPGELAEGTEIVATPPRASAHDVMIGTGRRVGTSSLRRRAQLLATDPELDVVELRGNVDTRLRKLADGEVDALVLAAAGLERLSTAELGQPLTGPLFVPAPGQGILALQARVGEARVAQAASELNDPDTFRALAAERAAVRILGASCHTPVGVLAAAGAMRGFVGMPDGSRWVIDEIEGFEGATLAQRMLAAGAAEILAAAEAAA